ncbi:protein arginine N-methyltransferase 9-like isoform X1 [Cloeon dipterum]|uniref:protein arginine N-methyltransferase 9-like isoform X1 n=2 Tax=Cloeon dipterum TaxID=197152 RepID=UPI00321F7CC8
MSNNDAIREVALNSRAQALSYLGQENWGRAFAHLTLCLKLEQSWQEELQEQLSDCLCSWGKQLEEESRYKDLLHCYQQALEIYPNNHEVLNNLGAHLFRMGHLEEAKSFFEKALAIKKDFLPAAHNMENLTSTLVERWHFRMLNDSIRNESYREAILKKIRQGFSKVLDIGTGTSLLSLYAVQGGAKRVFACECSAAMIEIAKEVILDNNVESKIELLQKMSTDLSIPADIPSRVSLVVTETLDAGVFGENVLQTLIDAWDRLLLPQSRNLVSPRAGSRNGIVVPFGVKIYAAGVQCAAISRMNTLEPSVWDALGLGLEGTRLAAAQNEAYNSEKLEYVAGGYTFITSPVAVLEVNFNDPQDLQKHLAGEHDKKMEVSCCDAGQIDAFVSWFVLQVDEDLKLSSEPGKKSCWEQAVFALSVPLELQSGQTVNIAVSSSHGLLKIQPDSQELTPEIMLTECVAIEMLNDSTWTRSMQMVANSFKGKAGLKVLDLSPFPYLGLLLLKMGVCDKLRCSGRCMSLARKVAGDNCDLDDFNKADKLDCFDLIILYPCTPEGELDQETILYVSQLRKRLSPQGVMLPKCLSIIGQIWNSDWLESVSQLQTDEHVSGFKIASHVNKYKLKRHLDLRLQSTPHAVLSEPKEIFSVKLCEHLTEEPAKSELPLISTGKVTAVAHWFQFDYGQGVEFQTNQIDSYPRQAAVLLEDNMTVHEGQKLKIESCLQAGVVNIKVSL